eukprot:jgi/Botrbrau1/11016/Bobra.101_1s0014.1
MWTITVFSACAGSCTLHTFLNVDSGWRTKLLDCCVAPVLIINYKVDSGCRMYMRICVCRMPHQFDNIGVAPR